jgi:hypothetical protein
MAASSEAIQTSKQIRGTAAQRAAMTAANIRLGTVFHETDTGDAYLLSVDNAGAKQWSKITP